MLATACLPRSLFGSDRHYSVRPAASEFFRYGTNLDVNDDRGGCCRVDSSSANWKHCNNAIPLPQQMLKDLIRMFPGKRKLLAYSLSPCGSQNPKPARRNISRVYCKVVVPNLPPVGAPGGRAPLNNTKALKVAQ